MKTTYEHFDQAFGNVEGYVILAPSGEYVARVALKYPRDGASRLWCYFQAWGAPMVRAYAGGYGYDKGTAAFNGALRKAMANDWSGYSEQCRDALAKINDCCGASRDGHRWQSNLESAGYRVLHVFG